MCLNDSGTQIPNETLKYCSAFEDQSVQGAYKGQSLRCQAALLNSTGA